MRARTWRRGVFLLCLCAALLLWGSWRFEDRMVFRPKPGPETPQEAELANYTRQTFTHDGLTLPYWAHTTGNGTILLYFHGNGAGLWGHTALLDTLARHGLRVMAMEYRGYPGAPGHPSQRALVGDAVAFYDHIRARYPQQPIHGWGYSLGSGVAVQLAAQRPLAKLVLEAPFTSVRERAQQLFPSIPTGLMRHPFPSRDTIARVHAPLLIIHGEADGVIPISMGEALYAAAHPPKQFIRYAGAGHSNLGDSRAYTDALQFILR